MARSSFLSILGSTTFKAAPDKPIRSNFPASTRFNEPFISNSANLMLDEPLLMVRTKLMRRCSQYPPNSAGTVVPLASQASTIRLDKTVRQGEFVNAPDRPKNEGRALGRLKSAAVPRSPS